MGLPPSHELLLYQTRFSTCRCDVHQTGLPLAPPAWRATGHSHPRSHDSGTRGFGRRKASSPTSLTRLLPSSIYLTALPGRQIPQLVPEMSDLVRMILGDQAVIRGSGILERGTDFDGQDFPVPGPNHCVGIRRRSRGRRPLSLRRRNPSATASKRLDPQHIRADAEFIAERHHNRMSDPHPVEPRSIGRSFIHDDRGSSDRHQPAMHS